MKRLTGQLHADIIGFNEHCRFIDVTLFHMGILMKNEYDFRDNKELKMFCKFNNI